jgi:hypothetical protein
MPWNGPRRRREGRQPHEIGVSSARRELNGQGGRSAAGAQAVELNERSRGGCVAIGTSTCKGLSSALSPSWLRRRGDAARAESKAWPTKRTSKGSDTERHLLYVARTRARDHLLVTGIAGLRIPGRFSRRYKVAASSP